MYWDDGRKSAVYAVDNDTSSSRLGFVGKHRFSSELSGGYRVEVDSTLTLSSEVSSGDPWGQTMSSSGSAMPTDTWRTASSVA